eukprot:1428338-Alexandrium_andersonii.AAC.1
MYIGLTSSNHGASLQRNARGLCESCGAAARINVLSCRVSGQALKVQTCVQLSATDVGSSSGRSKGV